MTARQSRNFCAAKTLEIIKYQSNLGQKTHNCLLIEPYVFKTIAKIKRNAKKFQDWSFFPRLDIKEGFGQLFYQEKWSKRNKGEGRPRSAKDKTTFNTIVQRNFVELEIYHKRMSELASNAFHCCKFLFDKKYFFTRKFSFSLHKSIKFNEPDARVRSFCAIKRALGCRLTSKWKEARETQERARLRLDRLKLKTAWRRLPSNLSSNFR